MSDRIAEIRARLDAATPGPWECGNDDGGFCWVNRVAPAYGWYTHHADTRTMEDAQFIAHAPADIAWLLAELDARDERIALLLAEVTDLEALRG